MKPAIAVQAIFGFVSSWNNYFTPALILHDDKKKTLPILIAQLRAADWLKFDMGQVYVMIIYFTGNRCVSDSFQTYCTGSCSWQCERIKYKFKFLGGFYEKGVF